MVLFEGGLTLEEDGYRRAPRLILRSLTDGVVTTWVGIAGAVWLIGRLSLPLVIVSANLLISSCLHRGGGSSRGV